MSRRSGWGWLRAPAFVLLWVLGGGAAILLIALDVARLDGIVVDNRIIGRDVIARLDPLVSGDGVVIGRDFLNVWTAGRLLTDGRPELLYDVESYRAYQEGIVGQPLDAHNYSYPPLGLPLTLPLGLLEYTFALMLWLSITAALFVHAAKPWMKEAGLPAILVLALPASLLNVWTGHYGFLIGALWLYGWRALTYAPHRAGLAFGLIALKPHLGLVIPVILASRKRWRAFAAAAATVSGLALLSLALFGAEPWLDYLARTSREQARMIDAGAAFFGAMSTSAATAVFTVGGGGGLAFAAQVAAATAGIAMIADASSRGARATDLGLLAATATFLILPYAFIYDLTIVSLAAAWLLHARWRDLGVFERIGAGLGFFAPQIGFLLAWGFGAPVTPLFLLALALVQWRLIRRDTMIAAPARPAHD